MNNGNTLNKSNQVANPDESSFVMNEKLLVSTPEKISSLVHEKKEAILRLLIESEYTIRELSREAGINPGTVKRHMIDLEKDGFIQFIRQEKNKYGIFLKYYRAIAKKYVISYEVP